MKIKFGSSKIVLVFNKFVIKLPKTVKGIFAVYSEHYLYYKVPKEYRVALLKNYFIPLIPISVQRKAEVCETYDEIPKQCVLWEILYKTNGGWEAFTDEKPDNYGYVDSIGYKTDYDFLYMWYNMKVNIFGYVEDEMSLYRCILRWIKKITI